MSAGLDASSIRFKTWCQKSEVSRMQDLGAGCCWIRLLGVFLLGSPTTPIQVVIRYLWCYTFRLSFQTPCRRRRTSALSKVEPRKASHVSSCHHNWLNTKFTASQWSTMAGLLGPVTSFTSQFLEINQVKYCKYCKILCNCIRIF